MTRRILLSTFAAIVLLAPGCGEGNRAKLVPVSGTIYLDDKPLAKAEVNFFCERTNHLGTGLTDANGRYQLYPAGAVGDNIVWVTTAKNSETNPADPEDMGFGLLGEKVPDKYNNPDTSILRFKITGNGTDKADFHLTTEGQSMPSKEKTSADDSPESGADQDQGTQPPVDETGAGARKPSEKKTPAGRASENSSKSAPENNVNKAKAPTNKADKEQGKSAAGNSSAKPPAERKMDTTKSPEGNK